MADTFVSTNYNGELNDYLYKVMGLGNETAQKGGYHLIPDVAMKEELDYLETTEDPFTDYVDDTPSTGATATTMKKRELSPLKFTVWGQITPSAWLPIWRKYRSIGTLTQLSANPQFLADVFELIKNASARQLDKLFWQGNTAAGASSPLRFFDGIIKKIEANSDTNVNFVTAAGTITQSNVVAILEAFYAAIPNKFFDDPDFTIMMNTGDFKLLQYFNNSVKSTTVGVLDESIKRLFLEKRIQHFNNLPASRIVGAKTSNAPSSNLVLGMYADLESEIMGLKVEKKELSNITRYRFDGMADTQYRFGGDIVYYKPA
ncbi:MAG: hypothetical protein WC720_05115 [Candidatus Shapirobacteria bacterium]|jgi:hypothetical protein